MEIVFLANLWRTLRPRGRGTCVCSAHAKMISMEMPILTDTPAWKALLTHSDEIKATTLKGLFATDPARGQKYTAEASGIFLDYSKNRINDETIKLLLGLAEQAGLQTKIEAMFTGQKINITENRAVLHVALRAPASESIIVDGEDVIPPVHAVLDKMAGFADKVRSGAWKGFTGKPIKNVVNIGIGGSDLGPVMAYEALRHYSDRNLTMRFVSNVDGTDFAEAVRDLSPDETIFLVASKTFTTLETMDQRPLRARLDPRLAQGRSLLIAKHFVAISTNAKEVAKFGIDTENMFGFWDWVGGRYSMDSAIGLSTMIAIGPDNFRAMLAGFHEMDTHFRTTPLAQNLPVLLGLLTVWYTDFFDAQTVAILPYEQYLKRFPAYLQQLTMESNGKHVTLDGQHVTYETGPVYWGEPGTNGQHSFYQLIHQGTRLIPCDFIGFYKTLNPLGRHHDMLIGPMSSRRLKPLAFGKDRRRGSEPKASPKPSCRTRSSKAIAPPTLSSPRVLTPEILGKLVALYEHSVFTQGAIWNIDSFDQWGVELGKILATRILGELEGSALLTHDSSTNALIELYRKNK